MRGWRAAVLGLVVGAMLAGPAPRASPVQVAYVTTFTPCTITVHTPQGPQRGECPNDPEVIRVPCTVGTNRIGLLCEVDTGAAADLLVPTDMLALLGGVPAGSESVVTLYGPAQAQSLYRMPATVGGETVIATAIALPGDTNGVMIGSPLLARLGPYVSIDYADHTFALDQEPTARGDGITLRIAAH